MEEMKEKEQDGVSMLGSVYMCMFICSMHRDSMSEVCFPFGRVQKVIKTADSGHQQRSTLCVVAVTTLTSMRNE